MIYSLIAAAFGQTPTTTATVDIERDGDRRKIDTAVHVGLNLTGTDPGVTGRFDFGHRVSVEGVVFGAVPTADALKWTGGASIGIQVAPLRLRLGTHGSVDLRLGAGLKAKGNGLVQLEGPGWDLGSWASGTLHVSPDGTWSLYGGGCGRRSRSRSRRSARSRGALQAPLMPSKGIC